MTAGLPLAIGPLELGLAVAFVLASGCVSLAYGLGLARDLFWGTVRTFAQLFAMGWALKFIFGLTMSLPVLAVYVLMVALAARIVLKRVKEPGLSLGLPLFGAMLGSYALVAVMVTGVVVNASPWWLPQYFLPLGGMIIGNSMNALAISLERLFSLLRQRRDEVEMRLSLGADASEASRPLVREAVKAGMIPSINAMMGVGVVFIPGMMTGQILAGADPMLAVRYQIVVMLMLTASSALSAVLVIHMARRRCFTDAHQLKLRPETDTQP